MEKYIQSRKYLITSHRGRMKPCHTD